MTTRAIDLQLDAFWREITWHDEAVVAAERAAMDIQGTEEEHDRAQERVVAAKEARRAALAKYAFANISGASGDEFDRALTAFAIRAEVARRGRGNLRAA